MLFLWNVSFIDTSREVTLEFYNSSSEKLETISVEGYRPYFLTRSPLSKDEEAAAAGLEGHTARVTKRNLFTGDSVQLTQVRAWTPALLKKLAKEFASVWESEVEYGRSYIYDNNLVFGAPYTRREDRFTLTKEVPRELSDKFQTAFSYEAKTSPLKCEQIREWFDLGSQLVPDVSADLLGDKGQQESTKERTHMAFLLARIANIPVPQAYSSKRVSDWIKSMIYTYLRRNNILIPTSTELRRGQETHAVPGALTIEPEAGVYFNTVVCDFESLYPSCIDSYNLSYETVDCPHEECRANKISEVGHHVCTKRKGFYSLLIGALKDLRIHWFKPLSADPSATDEERDLAKAASRLLKLFSVSSYGVTVRIHGVACPPLAESITGYGRWALQTTWDIAKSRGMHPTYGDTDSVFLDNPQSSQVQDLIRTVKKQLNLDLAVDKQYTLCVLPEAKKAYFGITEDGTPDLKGLTAVKSNAPKLIQRTFRDCVKVLSNVRNMQQYAAAKTEVAAVVHETIRRLRERRLDFEDLVYSVQLFYDPTERLASSSLMPQPYQSALQQIDSGEKLSRRDTVNFVKVKPFNYKGKTFTVKPVSHVKTLAEINVEDYIRNLATALEQAFKPMGITLEKEVKLTDWFKH